VYDPSQIESAVIADESIREYFQNLLEEGAA
jgi:hypothetical protein